MLVESKYFYRAFLFKILLLFLSFMGVACSIGHINCNGVSSREEFREVLKKFNDPNVTVVIGENNFSGEGAFRIFTRRCGLMLEGKSDITTEEKIDICADKSSNNGVPFKLMLTSMKDSRVYSSEELTVREFLLRELQNFRSTHCS